MLPEQPISFPEFVADQLLTAKNLNELFHYLDVQERGTRINLIGIGIVCGLELRPNAAGTEIIITKGCGITSEGYLVRWDETKLENYKPYDAEREIVYPPFISGGKQKFPIDELKANSSEEGLIKLTKAYLDDKVVLLFVELLRIDAKNCDPESCDDKGRNITLTIRPLVVNKKDAVLLTGGVSSGNGFIKPWVALPELFMPRHHVPAEDIFDSGDVFEGFQQVLQASFLGNVEKTLSQTYARLQPLVKDFYPSNPFTGTANAFAFIHNGTITVQQLVYMQYYYDLFSDVIQAYEELRKSGMRLLSLCCPDENLFPRHLLLGLASVATSKGTQEFRHHFIPSPAVCCHRQLVDEIRSLFIRLVLLLQRFVFDDKVTSFFDKTSITVINRASSQVPIRVTPSKLGDFPLSEKAIPYYYDVVGGSEKLYQQWNYQRRLEGRAEFNLSYHAPLYASHDAVLRPLHYDLEPYNFLRIEGHVGHRYTEALATISQIRDTNRLPFDVIALGSDIKTLREILAAVANSTNYANLRESFATDISLQCHFQDLEAIYDTMVAGLICMLCKETKYYYSYPTTADTAADQIPLLPLLRKCDPTYKYRKGSIGERFEIFYKTVGSQPYITPDQFFAGNFTNSTFDSSEKAASMASFTLVTINFLPFFAILYYMEKLSEVLTTTLISFNIVAFYRRYSDLMTVAQKLKDQFRINPDGSNETSSDIEIREDFRDHVDTLLYACLDARFIALYNDYKVRWVYLAMLQKFGYYTKMHPGIQHKAGVPMGGTFILVYHERSRVKTPNTNIFTNRLTTATSGFKAADTGVNIKSNIDETKNVKASKSKSASKEAEQAAGPDAAVEAQAQAATNVTATNLSNVHQLESVRLKAQLTTKQMALIDRLFFKDLITRHSLDELTNQLPDRIVIADFYLPYICCSDCPPVQFIINETAEPQEGPTISITNTQYCNSDKTAYPITVTPSGGSFGSSEGVSEVNGVFVFNPSAVVIDAGALNKIIALTYTKDGLSASVNVTVFAKPKAEFDIIQATTYNFFVFANKSTLAASVTWDFGDGVTATGDNPSHAYQEDGTYVVTLKAVNGVCSDTISKTISVVKANIQIDGKELCSADKSAYPIQVNPEGGAVTGEGTIKTDSGFNFLPSVVAFAATQGSKDILLIYTINNQQVTTTVKVFRTPSANFTVDTVPGASPQIRSFKTANTFPAQYFWDFGDGSTSVEVNPVHMFQKTGTFVVKLTVSNGPCTGSTTQTLVVSGPPTINITPTQFCSSDKGAYSIVVSPEGGQASGEGVGQSPNGLVFSPASVVFATGQAQKTVQLSYSLGGITAQTTVVVFATPDPTFRVQNVPTAANARSFTPNTNVASIFAWSFGDGQASTDRNPIHVYQQPGTYVVTLTVGNGPCKATSEQNVVVTSDHQPTKTCAPLTDILSAFQGLPRTGTAALFKAFVAIYQPYNEVDVYFGELAKIISESTEVQIKFFIETNTAALLDKWFTELNPLVQNSDVRVIAIALWRILTDLADYIMCIQKGDFKDNEINLAELYNKLEGFIKQWIEFEGNFSKIEDAQLGLLLQDITAEQNRLVKNEEDKTKKAYGNKLDSMNKMLTGYLKASSPKK